ncbi:SDR family NAD(P)-dependent oxidoreductase [Hydrogenophaga sp. BPS33]|uniref:SDR family NAD(P)-dependent oxidoreductase n=1 Tax=Hydrogenophaga sp. BPS33 TaxID=2651974 RepID=UPI00131F7327|nr:SDR family NAD(P)-dependent oxidoreductase [Hydrogenophaga sp. BPS33]QHE85502.1 SDR family oxidoreductase [Hydrogenophaga sp. BPS33]
MSAADPGQVPDYAGMLRLDGRNMVVLGAGQGIGRQVSHALAQCGARVLCVDHDPALADAVALECGGLACAADVTQREGMAQVFAHAERHWGAVHGIVDIVGRAHIAPIEATSDEAYQAQHDMVFRHAWLALQLGAPAIAASGGGSIVFIGSTSAVTTHANQSLYGANKAALHHLARCAAVEYGPRGVRVNTVAPGTTRTPRVEALIGDGWDDVHAVIPLRRSAEPADIASVVLFLMSPLARHVTAQALVVDGGITATTMRSGVRKEPQGNVP